MKKLLIIALVASMALGAMLLPERVLAEESNILTAEVLNLSKTTKYHAFNAPKDILYTDEGLYISTDDGYEIYSDGEFGYEDNRTDDFAYVDKLGLVTLHNGNIISNSGTIDGDYTAITAYDYTLYALHGSKIDQYEYNGSELTFVKEYVAENYQIKKIAATENGCIYTTQTASMTTIHVGETPSENDIKIPREIIDIQYNGSIYALTSGSLKRFEGGAEIASFLLEDPIGFTLGDRAYVLTWTGSIKSVALDLAAQSAYTMIASLSDENWFYYAPVSGSSRLGKIYAVDRDLSRIAIIEGEKISYISEGLIRPVAVATDNAGAIYVVHSSNHVACFKNGKIVSDKAITDEAVIDIDVDYSNNVYCLTASGNVIDASTTAIITSGVRAMEFQNGWHYMTDEYIDDIQLTATDFCVDIAGNIFAVSGNTITAVIGGETTEYTVENAEHINAVTISKADNAAASYGDLLLFDDVKRCVLKIDGAEVGSVNIKDLYTAQLTSDPIGLSDGAEIIGEVQETAYLFVSPIEGEIAYELSPRQNVIICDDIASPDPFLYCVYDDPESNSLIGGFVYKDKLLRHKYTAPKFTAAKVNADKTPIFKYPSVNAPKISHYDKGKLISILSFVLNYHDKTDPATGWYADAYPEPNLWYRISFEGETEGYILVNDTNVNYFSDVELPKTNATIINDTELYIYDEATGKYVKFDDIMGGKLPKNTRVVVETPFDTSREYTKVVFRHDQYGTLDFDCYVKTKDIEFDGVDIVKIIAVAVIIVALITLILVIIRKRRLNRRTQKKFDVE